MKMSSLRKERDSINLGFALGISAPSRNSSLRYYPVGGLRSIWLGPEEEEAEIYLLPSRHEPFGPRLVLSRFWARISIGGKRIFLPPPEARSL